MGVAVSAVTRAGFHVWRWSGDILAMALALTCPRDCMAGRSPQAGAPRLRRSHDEMLQTPALPLHEAPQALLITHKASASPGTASAYEGDFRHSSDVLFTRQKSAACRSSENMSLRRGGASVCRGIWRLNCYRRDAGATNNLNTSEVLSDQEGVAAHPAEDHLLLVHL